MTRDSDYNQDGKTVLVDRHGHGVASAPLTDLQTQPRFEQLEERMIYSARLGPAEAFNVGLNALVAAASELLSEVARLKRTDTPLHIDGLREHLTSALELFEVRALHKGVESSEVMGARYVLCTVIDEAVVTTSWGKEGGWSQMSLLSSFHNETFGGGEVLSVAGSAVEKPGQASGDA